MQENSTDLEGTIFAEDYLINKVIRLKTHANYYEAYQISKKRKVHIKIISDESLIDYDSIARFIREGDVLKKLTHPNILDFYSSSKYEGIYYIVTQHINGLSLREVIQENAPLNEATVLDIAIPIAEALDHTWSTSKIIHRDIKPENILISSEGLVYIRNFTIAKPVDDINYDVTMQGFTFGTPEYMSPERITNLRPADYLSDMYSLGSVMYDAFTGTPPFYAKDIVELAEDIKNTKPKALRKKTNSISRKVSDMVDKMLSKNPDERPQTWNTLIAEMKSLREITKTKSKIETFILKEKIEKYNLSSERLQNQSLEPKLDNSIEIGTIIKGNYRVDSLKKESLFGNTYEGIQLSVDRKVLIKVLPFSSDNDSEAIERFLQEVELTAKLSHPNIQKALDAGEENAAYYFITKFPESKTLEEVIAEDGVIEEEKLISIILQIADALQYAWKEHKVVHRDIKCENILLTSEGKPILLDFGIAKNLNKDKNSADITCQGFTVGTPEYISPEQINSLANLDFRADMYSLGIVMYKALTGLLPFTNNNQLEVIQMHLDETAESVKEMNEELSERISGIVDRMLAKNRDDRFASWQIFITKLKNIRNRNKRDSSKSNPKIEKNKNKKDRGLYIFLLFAFIVVLILLSLNNTDKKTPLLLNNIPEKSNKGKIALSASSKHISDNISKKENSHINIDLKKQKLLFKRIFDKLRIGNPRQAIQILRNPKSKNLLYSKDYNELFENLNILLNAHKSILETFKKEIGKNISVYLKYGKFYVLIKEVTPTQVNIESQGNSKNITNFTFEDLSHQEILIRLYKIQNKNRNIVSAYLSLEMSKTRLAARFFANCNSPFTSECVNIIDAMKKNKIK